jgi:NAD(P)H-hydrate epimerase
MALNPERLPVMILCGPGNNGGDGFVIARHLDNHGWPVSTWLVWPEDATRLFGFGQAAAATDKRLTPDCQTNAEIWATGRPIHSNATPGGAWKGALVEEIEKSGWVADALYGTGLSRPLSGPHDELIPFLNATGKPVLAVDLPSGLDCDTGAPLGPAVKATHTATFVAPKKGFLNPESRQWTGEVHVIDIGAPRVLVEEYRTRRTA